MRGGPFSFDSSDEFAGASDRSAGIPARMSAKREQFERAAHACGQDGRAPRRVRLRAGRRLGKLIRFYKLKFEHSDGNGSAGPNCRNFDAMKIHEYQGKELLKKFGVPVPRSIVARTADEAFAAAQELATTPVVVKAQIHAGGRGKGGGVKLAKTPEEARDIAQKMLGMK